MKACILVALLYFTAVGLYSQPKDSPAKNETPATQGNPTLVPSNNDHKPADHTETAKDGPPHWYTSSEWWLVIIAALTGAAIAYQAGEMVRATKVIERQTELQEAHLSQWVDLEPRGLIVHTTSKTNPPKEVTLNLRWRVFNNTPFPFTLQNAETKVAIGLDWEHFETGEQGTIAPAKSSRNYFDFMVPLKLTKAQTKSFFENGVGLSITSRVSYIDASGYEQDQIFGDLYHCTFPHKFEVTESLGGMTASWVRTEKGDPKPDIVLSREKYFVETPEEGPNTPEKPT